MTTRSVSRIRRLGAGFTLIEVLVVVALIAIVLAVAVPSFKSMILTQRLKSVHSQLVTDLQFARAEAAARNQPVYWRFGQSSGVITCYTIYTTPAPGFTCNCLLGVGSACPMSTQREIRSVQLPDPDKVKVGLPAGQLDTFAFDHVNGGIFYSTTDFAAASLFSYVINAFLSTDTNVKLTTTVSPAGRPSTCAPATAIVGVPAC